MKPEQFSSLSEFSRNRLLAKRACLLGSMGVLSGSLLFAALPAVAETEEEAVAPTPVEAVPVTAPVETSAELLLRPQVTATPVPEPAPVPVVEPAPAAIPPQVAPAAPIAESEPEPSGPNVIIDTTDYSLGATKPAEAPSLVFSDRSTGCQFTLEQGQSTPTRLCGETQTVSGNGVTAMNENGFEGSDASAIADGGFSVGPVNFSSQGVSVGSTTVISRDFFNERLRPLNLLRAGAEEFVFPLSTPAQITSLFGWRNHPIFEDLRFHAGTDIGAPEGTPVLATRDGKVRLADYLGGYGFTVILRHEDDTLETRYAHLSQILVRPGETVKQGEVVGLVGSTGNSTGPHLHFELRELTSQGWVLIDPDELMEYAMKNLMEAINNPLLALGLSEANQSSNPNTKSDSKSLVELPYRPAQPNAN